MAPSFSPYEYEVFVSFRGADNRTGFTRHLFAALDRKTIHAYKDDIKAIEISRIAVVVFSKKYATSDWCLDELVKIMECKRVFNQRVLPIFYHVSQPEVLEQKGNFAELPNGPEDKMNGWRAALMEAANLEGLHLEPNRPESEFIEEIVENIWKKLNEESSTAPSLSQNDAPGQHSSATIPHNDASSGQALGGHRASHKEPRLMAGDLIQNMPSSPVKPKTHECSICGLEFSIGQALRGHMRWHMAAMSEELVINNDRVVQAVPIMKKSNSKKVLCLYSNLLPLENDLKLRGWG